MAECSTYHLAAVATGVGAAAISSIIAPDLGLDVIGVTALSGYVGGLLPDIDNTRSSSFRMVQRLSRLAAVLVPVIQFIYRPTDLLLAIPVALFMVTRFWEVLGQITKRGGHTHSVIAAVCLSLGVAWVAYLTVGSAAALPAFLASSASYLLHLLLDDLDNIRFVETKTGARSALLPVGRGRAIELYSILAIGLVSFVALWSI
ncbi:metal-dependent hydrolase [Thiothrix lacustris]|uniref:metal-dependent hydrolase n=1 Tax=Thiothrix lacustris TaxID=525917 RepID=UPI00048CDBEC|nr:metal-dependent hydrolase [Thiothrix lacustris]